MPSGGAALYISNMNDCASAETLNHFCRIDMARAIADAISEEYAMLELSDIMEWKRTRSRR